MKKTLLTTATAVALLAGPGLVLAQKNEKNDPSAQTQQSTVPVEKAAPAEKMTPPTKVAPAKGAETKGPDAKAKTTGQIAPKMEPKADKADAASDIKPNVKPSDSKGGAKPNVAQTPSEPTSTALTATSHAAANLSVAQRTQISAAIKQQNVPRVSDVNFSISIGTRVPRTLHFYPLPAQVVEVYPIWRGSSISVSDTRFLVIDPHTQEIVAVLEA